MFLQVYLWAALVSTLAGIAVGSTDLLAGLFHFLRLVKELKPRVFVMENVPGMATGQHTQMLDELIDGFREAGYRVRLPYRILNAANYGVPQDRRRVFLLGARSDTRLPDYPRATTRLRGNGRNGNGADRPVTPNQLRLLKMLAERGDGDLTALCCERFGKTGIEDLSTREASRLIEQLNGSPNPKGRR